MSKEQNNVEPVLCSEYSTLKHLEILEKYMSINDSFTKFRFISMCSGIELIIKEKRFWFEFWGKQITPTDFYIKNSSFARMLHAATEKDTIWPGMDE